MEQLTKEQAIQFAETKAYESMSQREIAEFQLEQDKLCMPFDVFHKAITETLARPVYTHEFGMNKAGLKQELFLNAKPPSLEDIINLIPEEKRIVLSI